MALVSWSITAEAFERGDDETAEPELHEQPVGLHLRFGYEATSLRLDRLRFGGRAESDQSVWFDNLSYEHQGLPGTMVLHGISVQPNLVYQPSPFPLQLLVGVQFGFGLGAAPDYVSADGAILTAPQEEQLAVGLRAGSPFGLRLHFDPVGIRAQMVPAVAMVAIDEQVVGPDGVGTGTAVAAAFSLRGQLGLDVRLGEVMGFYVEGGYDLGAFRDWTGGAGIAFFGEPE